MSTSEDLNNARKKLFERLGENTAKYCQLMRLWFSMKLSKEEFDIEARKMMTRDQTLLHNEFLLCLFNKCGSLTMDSGRSKSKDTKKLKASKTKRSSDRGAFQLADPVNYLPHLDPPTLFPPCHLQEEPPRYCVQELFLPDHHLILGRLMLTSWEMGMEGAEDGAAELLVIAVQHFLKNIITAVLTQRNGFKLKERRMIHGIGSSVPNPWLRNYHGLHEDSLDNFENPTSEIDDNTHIKRAVLKPEEVERQAMYRLACAPTSVDVPLKSPVSKYDVFHALQVYKSAIPSHSLYAINMEKMIASLTHPSHDEIEAYHVLVDN